MAVTAAQMAAYRKRKAAAAPKLSQTKADGFTPFVTPTQAPIGSYDPAYDAQLENAQQGFGWTAEDFDTGNLRRDNDYATAMQRLGGQYGLAEGRSNEDYDLAKRYLGEDYGTSKSQLAEDYNTNKGYLSQDRDASLADLLTARTRGQEDYTRATGDLSRQYSRLGDSQTQNARAAGVAEGGALAQALAKRQANQAYDQSGIDTQNQRFMADNTLASQRTNQQYDRQSQALETGYQRSNASLDQGYQRQGAGLDLNHARGLADLLTGRQQAAEDLGRNYFREGQDANTAFTRAGIQNATFARQLNAQTLGIAAQNGMLPTKPANEHTVGGITYRNETHNGKQYRRLPNGRLVPVTQRLASAV